ncbi:MAG: GspH/FimT family pseudopilin [Gammaproteobacteria bacterium]|nr:GspH/FimT family pseudopilin [Gammaproteobacteria bacterium]
MNKNIQGFTLIELIVTMAVVSIVLLTGIPALNDMTNNNRLVAQINSIAGSVALARSEAIKTGTVVTVCASSDSNTCNVTTWKSGWIVFTDVDKDAVFDSGVDKKIQIQDALNGGTTLTLSGNDSSSGGIYQFLPDGSSRDRDISGSTVGTFTLCPPAGTLTATQQKVKAKAININFIGRASRAEDNDNNNIVENSANPPVDISC